MAQATAQAAAADSSAVAGPADVSPKATTGSEESGPAATLAWLTSFNLERKVLLQLISLKPRVVKAAGSGVFSGECKDCSGRCIPIQYNKDCTPEQLASHSGNLPALIRTGYRCTFIAKRQRLPMK